VDGEQEGQPHGHAQGLHQQGQDKQDLVNGISNVANHIGALFLQTRLTESEICDVHGISGAYCENQSVQKVESLN
jgi:hypothetical protein